MKDYLCIKDLYIEDTKWASIGDHVVLLQDNTTCVNTNGQKVAYNILNEDIIKEHLKLTYSNNRDNSPLEDKVNHPSHYTWLKDKCGIEVIDITRHMDFNLGNALKYILRAGHKSEEGYTNRQKEIEDLKKAIFYIQDKLKSLENENE